jgi:thiol-disulfide isomerase/thioredoxin
MRITKKLLVATVLFAGSMTVAALIYKSRLSTEPPGPLKLSAIQTTPVLKPVRSFKILEEPRSLENIRFVNEDWKAVSMADFRGKVILLNVWATWCAPCRAEMPTLDKLQAMLGGPDFEVVALSIDEGGIPVVKRFYEELGLKSLRIYVDPTVSATSGLKILGVPTTLLINRDGKEIGRYAGPAEWHSQATVDLIRRQLAVPSVARPAS